MGLDYSVIICSHNPRRDYFDRTLVSLREQTMARERWELLLIDNRSDRPLANVYDLSWHPLARDMREEELGLTPDRNAEPESKRRMGRSEKNVFWRTRHKLKDKCRALKREFLLRKRRLGEFGVRLHLLPRRVKHIYGPAEILRTRRTTGDLSRPQRRALHQVIYGSLPRHGGEAFCLSR